MGMSAGGLITPHIPGFDIDLLCELLERKFRLLRCEPIWEIKPRFDTRRDDDASVLAAANFHCIYNTRFSMDAVLHGDRRSYDRFVGLTGIRGRVVFFGVYDSGDTYGFTVFEDGELLRRRVYGADLPDEVETGGTLLVEQQWQPAILTVAETELYREELDADVRLYRNMASGHLVPDHSRARQLVLAVLESEFGFSLEDHGPAVQERFYRADQEFNFGITAAQAGVHRPWWRRFLFSK